MKKFKMLAVLATLAFTTGLAGCNKGNSNSAASNESAAPSSFVSDSVGNSSSNEDEGVVTRLVVKAPDTVIEEQKYNLEDYVTVYVDGEIKAGYPFKVEIKTEETAFVKNHELRVIGVGEIQLNITAGTKSAKFNTVAVSALAYKYEQKVKNVTNTYKLLEVEVTDKGKTVTYSDFITHNPRYVAIEGMWGKKVDGKQIARGGLIELRNGNVYLFNQYKDNTIDILDKLGPKLSNYIIGLDFNLPASAFETDYAYKNDLGEEITALVASRTDGKYDFDAQDGIFSTNLIDTLGQNDAYVPHSIAVYPAVDAASGNEYWRMDVTVARKSTPNVKTSNVATFAFDFNEDNAANEALDNHIDNAPLPGVIAFDEIPSAFDRLNTAKNYTLTSQVYICKEGDFQNETTQFDGGNTFLKSDDIAVTKVTENGYYSTYKGDLFMGAFVKNGAVTQIGSDGTTSPIAGITDLWGGQTDVVPGNLGTNAAVYAEGKFEITSKNAADGVTTIGAIGLDIKTWIQTFGLQDYLGRRLVGQFDALNENQAEEGFDYYQLLDLEFTISATDFKVMFQMSWDKDSEGNRYYAYIEFVYSNVGTTTIPELDSYLA